MYSKNDNKHGRGRFREAYKTLTKMKTYIYESRLVDANEFRTICLDKFPCLRYSRKRTIWEAIKRLAEKGNQKAIEFRSKVVER